MKQNFITINNSNIIDVSKIVAISKKGERRLSLIHIQFDNQGSVVMNYEDQEERDKSFEEIKEILKDEQKQKTQK